MMDSYTLRQFDINSFYTEKAKFRNKLLQEVQEWGSKEFEKLNISEVMKNIGVWALPAMVYLAFENCLGKYPFDFPIPELSEKFKV